MRSRASGFVVFVFVSVLAATASAQNTPGRLTGLVTDAQGAILPGVTVTATSPSLIGGTEHGDAAGRQVPLSGAADWSVQARVRALRIPEADAREHQRRSGPDDFGRRAATARVADRERDGDRRIAGDRRDDDQGRHQSQGRSADGDSQLDRHVGRAVGSARRPHAGLRRRRQPQEPAVRLRELRRAEPGARHHRRRRSHGRRRRHRLLRGLFRQRRSVGERARQRRRDELARRRDRDDDQERRQHVQGTRELHLRAGQLRRQQCGDARRRGPRLHVSAEW